MSVHVLKRRFTVAEYYRMADAGIFSEDDRVELIEGEIIQMTPIGSRHAAYVDHLSMLLNRLCGQAAIVRVQNPVRLDEESEVQPDLALLLPRPDFYASAHPKPEDVMLAIEVADASLRFDREVKTPLYARTAIREVWLVDLNANCLDVYRRPSPDGYGEIRPLHKGESLSPQALPEVVLNVDEIFG